MDVKVGKKIEILNEREQFQDWAHEKGFCLDAIWSSEGMPFEDGDTALAYSIWQASRQAISSQPSDLEIVQKALLTADKKSYCSLTFYPDGWEVEAGIEELVNGSDIESLLTWAKQTIGE